MNILSLKCKDLDFYKVNDYIYDIDKAYMDGYLK